MRTVFLGDSHLARLRRELQRFPSHVRNAAEGGASSRDLLRQAAAVGLQESDVVVLSVGTNDAAPWKRVPVVEFAHSLSMLVASHAPRGWVFVAPPGVVEERLTREPDRTNAVIDEYRQAAIEVCDEVGGHVVRTDLLLASWGAKAFARRRGASQRDWLPRPGACDQDIRGCTDERTRPTMRVRAAVLQDAPVLGRVMVDSWLSAHRGQMPESAWRTRVEEWTPEVSARAWARLLAEGGAGGDARAVLLVAEDDSGDLVALVLGTGAEDDESGETAQIDALYVLPDDQGRGIGRLLLQEAARRLLSLRYSQLTIGVLSANLPARAFYEAMGGVEIGQRTFDEEGHPLAGTVYGWPDLAALTGDANKQA